MSICSSDTKKQGQIPVKRAANQGAPLLLYTSILFRPGAVKRGGDENPGARPGLLWQIVNQKAQAAVFSGLRGFSSFSYR